jgi:hypothetical protein
MIDAARTVTEPATQFRKVLCTSDRVLRADPKQIILKIAAGELFHSQTRPRQALKTPRL